LKKMNAQRTPVLGEEPGDEEVEVLMMSAPRRFLFQKKYKASGALFLLLAGTAAVCAWRSSSGVGARGPEGVREDGMEEDFEVAGPGGKACSGAGKDCAATRCCNITGYKCYLSAAKGPVCLDSIAVGASSSPNAVIKMGPKAGDTRPGDLVMWDSSLPAPGTSLFCFEVYAKDTGSTKKTYDLELIQAQQKYHTSIFACDDFMVFSDVPVTIGGIDSVVIKMAHISKRKSTGTWVNSPAFQAAWSHIKTDGRWSKHDWTVKADPDCVFLPDRLKLKLSGQEVTEKGIYFTNCEHVLYGFFGSIEVISKAAVGNYLASLSACMANPKINNKTYGEDLFAQKCMNSVGVGNVEDFYLTTDGVCDAITVAAVTKAKKKIIHPPDCGMGTAAFHPLKKVPAYLQCLWKAQSHTR